MSPCAGYTTHCAQGQLVAGIRWGSIGLMSSLMVLPGGSAVAQSAPKPLAPSRSVERKLPAASAIDPGLAANLRYRLGPGDKLKMAVFRMEGYETVAEVLSDGTLNLPRLGSVPVWGLSLDEARRRITAGYATILRRPIVYLDLVEARPVRVAVSGEVQRPGLYSIGKGDRTSSAAAALEVLLAP